MEVAQEKVVTLHYTLKNEQGEVLDTSEGLEPLAYLHGVGQLVPGLEAALEGHSPGDRVHVVVPPHEGYGDRDPELEEEIPREDIEESDMLEVGMVLHSESELGIEEVTVIEITDDTVRIDGNHQLAGMTLDFVVDIVDVRDATKEELEHGHAHGLSGFDHDHDDEDE